jgi:hypothetical protein
MDHLAALDDATRRYRETETAHGEAQAATVKAVVAALRAGVRPTDVANHSPFTATYVRRIARKHGIEPVEPTKPKAGQEPDQA